MSSPPVKYLRYFDFTTYASLNPEKPLPGASVDVEFNRLKVTTDQTIDRLALIQNDDGTLRGVIGTAQLADGAVTTPKIADLAVTGAKLAHGALDGMNSSFGAIGIGVGYGAPGSLTVAGPTQLWGSLWAASGQFNGDLTVTGALHASIAGTSLVDGSVTTPKLADAAVTSAKLAANLILGEISAHNFSVTNNASVAGVLDAFGLLHAHQNLQVDGVSTFNGPVNFVNGSIAGSAITPGTITHSLIGVAAVDGSNIANDSINSGKIVDGSIQTVDLADGIITSAKIADGTIAPADLSPATLAIVSSPGNPRGAWAPATNYALNDVVTNGTGVYACLVNHVSGATFAPDLASGKWFQTGAIFDQSLNKADNVQFAHVGIGMAPTANPLDILQSQNAATIAQLSNLHAGAAASAQLRVTNANTSIDFGLYGSGFTPGGPAQPGYGFINSYGAGLSINTIGASPILFGTSNFVRMALDKDGNLGIGTAAPATLLDISKSYNGSTFLRVANADPGNANRSMAQFFNGGAVVNIGIYGGGYAGAGLAQPHSGFIECSANSLSVATTGAAPILFGTNAAERMRLDANGNLGLNRIPDAGWPASYSVFANGLASALYASKTGAGMVAIANAFYNGVSQIYQTNNGACYVGLDAGSSNVSFGIAPYGSAGSAANFRVAGAFTASQFLELYGPASGTNYSLNCQNGNGSIDMYIEQGNPYSGISGISGTMRISKNNGNSRSINAFGTVNVNGTDYAEYEIKDAACDTVAAGQIVGFTADGKITDQWALAISFGVKSTNPSFVGGDDWALSLGPRPEPSGMKDGPDKDAAEAAKAQWLSDMEALRQTVDRIAYCGKVPVNIMGALPGDYIVAAPNGAAIAAAIVAAPTFEQWRNCVGRVRRVLPDGRAEISILIT